MSGIDKDLGRAPSGQALVASDEAPTGLHPSGFGPSRDGVCCPNCGEDLALTISASLPAVTDLTVSLKVEPGQLMRLDTMAGIMSSWRDLQIAVADSMGCDCEVFLADIGQRENEFWFTGRITNVARDSDRSGEAGETGTGSTVGESAGR